MSSLTLLVPIGVLIGLIARAVKHVPQRYIDIMVMLQDRHTSRVVDQIVRDQVKTAEAFHDGLIQGMEDENEKYRGGTDH